MAQGFIKTSILNKIVLLCAAMLMSFGITIVVTGVGIGLYLDKLFELFSVLPPYSYSIYQYAGSAFFLLSISAFIHAVAKYNKPVLIILFCACVFVLGIEVWTIVTAYYNLFQTSSCMDSLYDTTSKGIRREINLKFACCGWKTYDSNSCSFTATDRKEACYSEMAYPIYMNYVTMIILISIATLFLILCMAVLIYQIIFFPITPPLKKINQTNPLLS
ncbi:hypothetical protein QTN25_005675 [Entamoeba marina]